MASIELPDISSYVGDNIRPLKEGSLIATSNVMPVFGKILKDGGLKTMKT